MIVQAIGRLVAGKDLSRAEMVELMGEVADGGATPAQVGAFLAALRLKGETVDEIAGAAQVMRQRAERVQVDREVFVDTCGTGGDGQNTFNISTTAAFAVAGAGVAVAKHGNRSVSSRCGSADVLAALGVDVDAPRDRVERCIAEVGIGFLFAPRLHPAFKAVAGIRRELAIRTVFNLLGPLANPAGARYQVMGVYEPRWVPHHRRGARDAGIGPRLRGARRGTGRDRRHRDDPGGRGEGRHGADLRDHSRGAGRGALAGGGAGRWRRRGERPHHPRRPLRGEGGPRDAVLANAAAALVAAGAAADLRGGVRVAAESIDRGAAREKLERLAAVSRG